MTDLNLRSSQRSSPGALIERRPTPELVFQGPLRSDGDQGAIGAGGPGQNGEDSDPRSIPVARVDGVAILAFGPESAPSWETAETSEPRIVLASEGLAALVERPVDELIGRAARSLLDQENAGGVDAIEEVRRGLLGLLVEADQPIQPGRPTTEPTAEPDPLEVHDRRGGFGRGPTDLESDVGVPAPAVQRTLTRESRTGRFRVVAELDLTERSAVIDLEPAGLGATTSDLAADPVDQLGPRGFSPAGTVVAEHRLVRADGSTVLVHAAYTPLGSRDQPSDLVLVEFRDLRQPEAERLLSDQATVVRALRRGYELGRICYQVAQEIEQELGDGSRCWVAIGSGDGRLEPVLSGELSVAALQEVTDELLEIGRPLARQVVAIDALSAEWAEALTSIGARSVWYLPLVGDDERELRGAVVIATPRQRPDRPLARALEHLAEILNAAVEQATVEADLVHQTLHDPLTGLPNRALLVDRLGQLVARLDRDDVALSVLLVDIDRFKPVNDTRGSEVGDRVLLEVANRLLATVRLGDTVGRLSNDQYLVLCAAGKDELDPSAVARRIVRVLSEPIPLSDGDQLHITASVGVAVIDEPGLTPEAIIGDAESALALATADGRGRMAVFEADHRHNLIESHRTEQALHRAIDAGELVIHYQPLVEVKTGFMVGAEALVRWDRPGHGLLGPPDFIPIAEESELIIPVGNWIVDRVCADLAQWSRSKGRTSMVTINLGARQLAADGLVPTVVACLDRHGLDARRLGFEIVESMEIRELGAAEANLNRLKGLGCRIAIDDFGIGHATLDYIRRFSMADALKIDRSFVAGLGVSREDTAIVDASIAMASSLGLQVVAEGVEDLGQLDALRERGVRYAQGYALSRPVPFDQVIELWRQARLFDPPWRRGPAARPQFQSELEPA